jgi:hypothetical protein
VQRLARIGRVDERTVLGLLARRQTASGTTAHTVGGKVVELNASIGMGMAVTGKLQVADGETQLLQLLVRRPEARVAGIDVDESTFEDPTNRRLFLAWREGSDLDARADDLDEDVGERYARLRAAELPDFDARRVPEMVREIASRLRVRRLQAVVAQHASAVTQDVAAARKAGSAILDSAARAERSEDTLDAADDEQASLAADFVALHRRQRELATQWSPGKSRPEAGNPGAGDNVALTGESVAEDHGV